MQKIEVQGHRGCRGQLPENTLTGFAHTLAIGVDAIEFDIGLSADDALVIVHDRVLSKDIFRDTNGDWIASPEPTVRSLRLDQLQQYDCGRLKPGSEYAARFPDQLAIDGLSIPTLDAYIDLQSQMGCSEAGLNIEVKISPIHPGDTAKPEKFVDLLLDMLDRRNLVEQSVIQSFDWRIPMLVRSRGSQIRTSCLSVESGGEDTIGRGQGESQWTGGLAIRDTAGSVPQLVAAVGADIWSPWHGDIDATVVREAHDLGQRVITWTVNETRDIERMIECGVDGIISDYPQRLRAVLIDQGKEVPAPAGADIPAALRTSLSQSV